MIKGATYPLLRWFAKATLLFAVIGEANAQVPPTPDSTTPVTTQESSTDYSSEKINQSRRKTAAGVAISNNQFDCSLGAQIRNVRLEGCTKERCGKSDVKRSLISLTDLEGRVLDAFSIERAMRRLKTTRLVVSTTARCEAHKDQGLNVIFTVVPQRYVRNVHLSGNRTFYRSELQSRLVMESGVAFTPGTGTASSLIKNQKDLLKRFYQENGFEDTEVIIKSSSGGDEGVDVSIKIKEGQRKKIAQFKIDARLTRPSEKDVLQCTPVDVDELRDASGLKTGGIFTERLKRTARSRMEQYLWSRGYVRPKIKISFTQGASGARSVLYGKGLVEVDVVYSGCFQLLLSIRDQTQDPYHPPTNHTLLEELPFGESGNFSWSEAQYGRGILQQYLQSEGYLFAKVNLDYRKFSEARPEALGRPIRGTIRYLITRGPLTEIRGIKIDGLPKGTHSTALGFMQSGSYDFFGTSGYLQVPRLIADLERVAQYFQGLGYFGFTFKGATNESKLQIERSLNAKEELLTVRFRGVTAEISRPKGENYIYVRSDAVPGARASLGRIRVIGQKSVEKERILNEIQLSKDQVFDRDAIVESVKKVRLMYQFLGFHKVKVRVECSSAERVELGHTSCLLWNTPVRKINLHYYIEEGPKLSVGEVIWSGNFRTKDHIIARDLPTPNTPFDGERIRTNLRKLRRLGIFSAVRPIFIGLDEQPPRPKVAMMVEIHENDAKSIDLAAGLETISRTQESAAGGFTRGLQQSIAVTDQSLYGQNASPFLSLPDFLIAVEAAYIDRNLFGRALELQIPIKYGLSTTEVNRYFSFTPTWIDRRFLGTELRFRTTVFGIYDRAFLTLDSLEAGIEFEFSQRLFDRILMALQLEFSGIQTAIPAEKFSPWSNQIKVRPQLALDFLDNPLNPTYGQYIGASVAYILENEEGEFRNFFKYDVQFKVFRNIEKSLIFGFLLRYGQGNSLDGTPLPENERFVLGGNKGVRGYQDDGVRQHTRYGCTKLQASNPDGDVIDLNVNSACSVEGAIPDGYSARPVFGGDLLISGSFELRFPILRRSKMWGSLFYDFGALAETLDDLNAKSFRQSVGFGFRYLIGGSIPLRLDYGIKVDRRCADFDEKGICIENESFGNLHLGILYTF